MLVIFCLSPGWHITWTAVAAGCSACCILVTFAMAMALVFSALNVFFRDFQNIVGTIMQFMHFLVPMMYPFTRVCAAHDSHPVALPDLHGQPGRPGRAAAAAVLLVPADRGPRATSAPQFPPDMYSAA